MSRYGDAILRPAGLFLLLAAVWLSATASRSESLPPFCDNLYPAGPRGYKVRGAGERCEGMYQQPLVGASVELISLHRSSRLPAAGPDVVLTISSPPLRRSLGSARVRVRAIPTRLRTYYRMDTEIAPGKDLRWPINDVLVPERLYPAGFGVLGWIEHGEFGRVYVPVRLRDESAKTVESAPPPITTLVRPIKGLRDLMWRIRRQYGNGRSPWVTVTKTPLDAEAIVPIPWSEQMAAGDGEIVTIDIAALADSGKWSLFPLNVLFE